MRQRLGAAQALTGGLQPVNVAGKPRQAGIGPFNAGADRISGGERAPLTVQ